MTHYCRACGCQLRLMMLQPMRDMGIPAAMWRCDKTLCREIHMFLYGDHSAVIAVYRLEYEEWREYLRMSRRLWAAANPSDRRMTIDMNENPI